jgi:hypothetical protein
MRLQLAASLLVHGDPAAVRDVHMARYTSTPALSALPRAATAPAVVGRRTSRDTTQLLKDVTSATSGTAPLTLTDTSPSTREDTTSNGRLGTSQWSPSMPAGVFTTGV